jgi:hypothetical protein
MTSRAMHGAYMSFVLPDDEVETAVRVLHTELQFDQMSTSDLSR